MGYESRFYVVRKSIAPVFEPDGKCWAEKIAMFDMCNMGDLYGVIHQYPTSNLYIFADDDDTRIVEDKYGEPLIEIPIRDMIKIIEEASKDDDYRRFAPFLGMLKGFNLNQWETELVVLHYGYKIKENIIMTIINEYKTETYDCGDGFLVDIVTANEEYATWLYHKTYGIKSHMFTMPIKQQSYEKFKEIVERNIVDYISFYAEDYFSDMVV